MEPVIVAARVDAFFFPPSSYKECECVGEQHKSRPHLHLLGTRDCYLNNDKQPTPHSFTAAIERHFFLMWVLPALCSDLYMQMRQVEPQIEGSNLRPPDVIWSI